MSFSDRRGQVSALIVAAIAASMMLSVIFAASLSGGAVTDDLNLNGVSNDDVSDVPDISFVTACLLEGELETGDIDITFTPTTAEFESDVPIDYLIVKGGQRMELFTFSEPLTEGEVTFGAGQVIDLRQPPQSCDPGDYGVKYDGEYDDVFTPLENNGPAVGIRA